MEPTLFNEEQEPPLIPSAGEVAIAYPPKYQPDEEKPQIWLKSIMSLAIYLLLGYYIFPSYKILLLITAIVLIHEMGHFLAMKIFRYNELGIFFIPLLGAYVSGSKREVSQLQSAIILLAGPLPGILIGIGCFYLSRFSPGLSPFGLDLEQIAKLFILLNLINLLPIYPLDGGQLLNRVFLDEESIWSKLFIFLSIGFLAWFAWSMYDSSGNKMYFLLLFFPVMILLRTFGDSKLGSIEKKIEEAGINADTEYEDLPDEDYWKIRNILIAEHASFKEVPPAPPYEFCEKEEKIMSTIQSLLHRHLIQDVSIAGKLLIFLIWAAGIATPWFIGMQFWF
ncbi:MAG TPA: site-2 protease family protein [Chitinophagaceae bacterium]|nr:site-2 protease family protein [Chitinophagaceae bacterium]HPH30319.1 site-2 protease family protein [Chitinophagaceae bacterium]